MKSPTDALDGRTARGIVAFLLLYFLARTVLLAFLVAPGIPPDESTHFGRVQAYASVAAIPPNAADTHHLGLLTHQPPLYYLVMGKLLWLDVTPLDDLVFLRLWNAVLGLLTAWTAWRCCRLITRDRLVQTLALVMVTHTLMFTGLSASVSYDNLTNLLAALAIYQLLVFFETRAAGALLGLSLTLLAGCLTKQSFLPLAAILLAALLLHQRGVRGLGAPVLAWLRGGQLPRWLAGGLVLVLLLANLGLYGSNLLRFGELVPRADRVVGLENALQNRVFARNWLTARFRGGELDYAEARARALGIQHPGDRATTLRLLRDERARRQRGEEPRRLGPLGYAASWSVAMVSRSVGYVGHLRLLKSASELVLYLLVVALGALATSGRLALGRAAHLRTPALVGVAYAAVLLWLVNYPAYARIGELDIGLQGRYVFPVMAPLWCLVAHGVLTGLPTRARVVVFVVVAALFAYGDLPWFLLEAPPAWFRGA